MISETYVRLLPIDSQILNYFIRSHWAIKNDLHWNLDVLFKEDNQLKEIG